MTESANKETIMELFGLENGDVEDVQYQNLNGNTQITIRLVPHYEPCPDCGCSTPKIKLLEEDHSQCAFRSQMHFALPGKKISLPGMSSYLCRKESVCLRKYECLCIYSPAGA